ncbi:RNA-binding cell elongation regulator Jag/EloR [Desulfosudis oleivorans]|uniref:RNA-binding protein KhpB n=1 Tax=Desulfosudis oleivorans (strain DSM 6200 / JCM 39069 / Hxd3) TaxID=96561 RepID=A8ZSK0_DESOH|nr:RNA-binding cell elongation regulator Jag/EloR [Desulfosudis oleivorans]ABW65913.1 single-stranded nucleic acid binding R3H domain protein [Desulfosudis oleivorans Hxd3]
MTDTKEFEGKNIDAALEKASSALNMTKDQLRYEVVCTGSSGIFGLVGVKNARIRILNSKKGSGGAGAGGRRDVLDEDRQEILSMLDEAFAEPAPEPESRPRPEAKAAPRGEPRAESKKAPRAKPKSRPRTEKGAPAPAERSRAAGRPPANGAKPPAPEERPETPPAASEELPESPPAPPVEVKEADVVLARDVLSKILDNITDEATVKVAFEPGRVGFSMEGGNSSVLIGKRGKTLKAMQHIVEKVVKKSMGEAVEVQVDVEGYLEKRASSLTTLASRLAEKARQTGKPTTISRMDAYERKIIHDALRTDRSVKTRSVGNGDIRNVVIHPGRRTSRKKTAP